MFCSNLMFLIDLIMASVINIKPCSILLVIISILYFYRFHFVWMYESDIIKVVIIYIPYVTLQIKTAVLYKPYFLCHLKCVVVYLSIKQKRHIDLAVFKAFQTCISFWASHATFFSVWLKKNDKDKNNSCNTCCKNIICKSID